MSDGKHQEKLIGPFRQLLTMHHLPDRGPVPDSALEIMSDAGILVRDGMIRKVASFQELMHIPSAGDLERDILKNPVVCLPGFVDAHTHICYAGSRSRDYALRVSGTSYLEIARAGGGIQETVARTRAAGQQSLEETLTQRCRRHLADGVTTCEVKSGYCLTVEGEMKMLRAIRAVHDAQPADLIATCLAAHMTPGDFKGTPSEYLRMMADELLPQVKKEGLSGRVDVFIEDSAFSTEQARDYLKKAADLGFLITIHADQFTTGGSALGCEYHAVSMDHLEASRDTEIEALARSGSTAVVLPGASMGLGMPFAPARKLLDSGVSLAIASDWNPGSAPMGDQLLQAAVLGAFEKLTTAETLAAITYRAARALALDDRGILCPGKKADFVAFPCDSYQEILYNQGRLKPCVVWKNGIRIHA